jgi:hypothetical protein
VKVEGSNPAERLFLEEFWVTEKKIRTTCSFLLFFEFFFANHNFFSSKRCRQATESNAKRIILEMARPKLCHPHILLSNDSSNHFAVGEQTQAQIVSLPCNFCFLLVMCCFSLSFLTISNLV